MITLNSDGSVEFRFFRPGVSQVGVAGDFNDWQEMSMAMTPDGDGWWVARAPLPPGEYRFRYRADGAWYTDYASYGVEFTPDGWNAVLVIPKAAAAT